jgi:hypothetical protein
MPVAGYFYPAGLTMYSGSTSANGASTHSTLSYYVAPLLIQSPVIASKIDVLEALNTSAAGTGSATVRQYFGLYVQSSDSLTRVSSWLGGFNVSQNSATAQTLSVVTGSASVSIASWAGNSTASFTGTKMVPVVQGATSWVNAGQYFAVMGMHVLTAGISPVSVSVLTPSLAPVELGKDPAATSIWNAYGGAFSSTSMTNAANSNQWLMPPSVATVAITATRSNEQIQPTIIIRGA